MIESGGGVDVCFSTVVSGVSHSLYETVVSQKTMRSRGLAFCSTIALTTN